MLLYNINRPDASDARHRLPAGQLGHRLVRVVPIALPGPAAAGGHAAAAGRLEPGRVGPRGVRHGGGADERLRAMEYASPARAAGAGLGAGAVRTGRAGDWSERPGRRCAGDSGHGRRQPAAGQHASAQSEAASPTWGVRELAAVRRTAPLLERRQAEVKLHTHPPVDARPAGARTPQCMPCTTSASASACSMLPP
ncbi:hypothetical protein XAP412_510078 [Xanthomonas phaseoli pv. phaseoli]|uniref:Uncharacterized protein n=1 Tax=Xanthomonas campestris pv. phaseoli TaxID=317013 RepID=A0ABY1TUP2_XANCH|nr:hypothetical protein XAP6984_560077 [Xanthomonas phaseoli pv. phaseoli]SON87020.1 hypothetical protein XAP412_510078 [Xanthomonas phaseoli pv. phaseoli]